MSNDPQAKGGIPRRKTDQDVTGWRQLIRLLSIRLRGRKAPAGPVQRRVKLRYAALAHDDSAPSPAGEGGTGLNPRPSSESEWQPESTATRMTPRPDAHTAGNWIPTLPAHYRLTSLSTRESRLSAGLEGRTYVLPSGPHSRRCSALGGSCIYSLTISSATELVSKM